MATAAPLRKGYWRFHGSLGLKGLLRFRFFSGSITTEFKGFVLAQSEPKLIAFKNPSKTQDTLAGVLTRLKCRGLESLGTFAALVVG